MVADRSTSARSALETHEIASETAGQPGGAPPQASIPRVDLADPESRAKWLVQMALYTADAVGGGLDATLRYSERVMSRPEARRQIVEAGERITALLEAVGYAREGIGGVGCRP